MSFHHIAIATRDMPATHTFYTQAMGFELVRVEKANTGPDAWAKHFFYDTGNGELMAFWELHDNAIDANFPTSISQGLGLPMWTNHIAFGVDSLAELKQARERINACGYAVTEIDHDWCQSIYVDDPNGILVEFCVSVREFNDEDKSNALAALQNDTLSDGPAPVITLHPAL